MEASSLSVVVSCSRKSEGDISDRTKKRHHQPPDEYAFHDPDRTINRTQAFKFRFQVVLALAAIPRIRFGFSPAGWALQSFSHIQVIISTANLRREASAGVRTRIQTNCYPDCPDSQTDSQTDAMKALQRGFA